MTAVSSMWSQRWSLTLKSLGVGVCILLPHAITLFPGLRLDTHQMNTREQEPDRRNQQLRETMLGSIMTAI